MASAYPPTREQKEKNYKDLVQAADDYKRKLFYLATYARRKRSQFAARSERHASLMRECSEKHHALLRVIEAAFPWALASALSNMIARVLGFQNKLTDDQAAAELQAHTPSSVCKQEKLAKTIAQDRANLDIQLQIQGIFMDHYIPTLVRSCKPETNAQVQ